MEVLIIEDDAPVRRLVAGELERHGLIVTEVASLAAAREVLAEYAEELVLRQYACYGGHIGGGVAGVWVSVQVGAWVHSCICWKKSVSLCRC